jgi:hypothetical protein
METKFHLLAVGQHFEWEGKSYVKTTPLIATQVPEGGQKFMPRAALVKAVGAEAAAAPITETPAQLDSTAVRNAIARYHQRCIQASNASAQQQGDVSVQLQDELEQLYRELLVELKL